MSQPEQDQAPGAATDPPSTAQLAYEACAAVALPGEPVTPWGQLPPEVQNGWHAAVNAVQRAHYDPPGQ